MRRRIFGIETEYGVTCTVDGQRRLSPDEVARYLFRRVVSWGRSSNVFLENGSRLYLDVGSHPEYATPECDSPLQVTTHDRAGERIVEALVRAAEQRLAEEGLEGRISLFKNNTDSAGNSYGCHENYLVARVGEFQRLAEALIPFLITRQVFAGAGKVLQTPRGTIFALAQRAEHIWEGVSSATTRSRPIINTRDEPHADAERFRRLHVIVGDSNMSEYTTWLKVATCDLVLRMLEQQAVLREMALDNPIRSIRDISHDVTGTRRLRLASGREMSALEIQQAYLERVERFVAADPDATEEDRHVVSQWREVLERLVSDPMSLGRKLDWVAKHQLIEAYQAKHDLALTDPRIALLDLAYHDVLRDRGLYHLLARQGRVEQVLDDAEVERARTEPPSTTRAALRGRFIREAKARRRDYTVDWVHLKLNDQAQRTVLCKDPFRAQDERVDRLIASM
ncbi:MAG: Pup--protein ligase [Nitriliruptor sp.]|nr:MAG: Pup--protein ligase [Nitriliruptor sp.]